MEKPGNLIGFRDKVGAVLADVVPNFNEGSIFTVGMHCRFFATKDDTVSDGDEKRTFTGRFRLFLFASCCWMKSSEEEIEDSEVTDELHDPEDEIRSAAAGVTAASNDVP